MFKDKLKLEREKLGLSQRQLSEQINVSQQAIGSWETGRTQPSNETLQQLADYFSVSVDYLLGRTTSPTNNSTSKYNDKKAAKISNTMLKLLEDKGVIKPGQDITDEQLQWLMKLVDKAIDMSKLK